MDFYKHLNYSAGNEDWSVEEQALRISPGDRAICVTASGDRSLHLLMTECSEVVSIDMNHLQNFLLELKLAAITLLDYEKYLAFLGCTPCRNRWQIFLGIKSYLSSAAIKFWSQQRKMVSKGILYQGRVEKLTHTGATIINILRPKKIATLFSFTNLDEQKAYVNAQWDTWLWQKIFKITLDPRLSKLALKDPGLNSFIEYENPGEYIYQRMLSYLQNHLARKSPLLQLMLLGEILPEAYFPYLTYEGYTKIRKNVNRLTYQTDNIIEYLNQSHEKKFDCFSLSDIASYMPQPIFEKLLTGIQYAANGDSRFCIREFISKRYIPNSLEDIFERDKILEKKLEKLENNFVYRFMVGNIRK